MDEYDQILHCLNKQAWAVTDTAIPQSWQQTLLGQAQDLWDARAFHAEGIGQTAKGGQRPDIRGDAVCWIVPDDPLAAHPFFDWMAGLRDVLNRRFDMGLRSQEFHFARYDPGKAGYVKHIDQHRRSDHRKISIVFYLNEAWNTENGGELCLYDPRDPDTEIRRFAPFGGRLAVFVSGVMPHAVMPCQQTRWSLTGWLRSDTLAPVA